MRRQIPDLPFRVPTDGRLKKIAVAIRQIGPPAYPRADSELNFHFTLRERAALGIESEGLVKNLLIPRFDQKLKPGGLKRSVIISLQGRNAGDRGARTSHGMQAVGFGDLRMTAGA